MKFHVWDVGGQDNLRTSWSNYFEDVDVLLFVVDSNDEENLTLAKMELHNCLLHPHLKEADLLVIANKQDVHGCLKPARIMEVLDLTNVRNHEWHIQPVVALTGQGLPQCMDWIAGRVEETFSRLKLKEKSSSVAFQRFFELQIHPQDYQNRK